jgi:predicted GIY-YIG superfamily endonuclease
LEAGNFPLDLDEISLAYAATVHKSQGSEYPAVVIPVHTQHYLMLQRNLLYTGITTDLERRIKEHNRGRGGRYTASRRPVRLVYSAPSPDRSAASRREARIKARTRREKESLIAEPDRR